MQRHTKNYMTHFEIAEQDKPLCEICKCVAVDVHHIVKRDKNQPKYDNIENLILLCRGCHVKAHANKITKGVLLLAHRQHLGHLGKPYEKQEYLKNIH